jgi:hypothetical protein
MCIVLGKLFGEDLGLQQGFFAPQDENRDEVSDKDLGTCLDLFAPKKAAKKKVMFMLLCCNHTHHYHHAL